MKNFALIRSEIVLVRTKFAQDLARRVSLKKMLELQEFRNWISEEQVVEKRGGSSLRRDKECGDPKIPQLTP